MLAPGSATRGAVVWLAAPHDARSITRATIPAATATRTTRVPDPIVGLKLSVTAWSSDTRADAASAEPGRSSNQVLVVVRLFAR